MAGFRSHDLAELARQMRFTPLDKRLEQLAAAESLLLSLHPAKDYPLDYLIDRITGYRPKDAAIHLVPGHDAQHDLGQLLEWVSATCCQLQADAVEPVLSIDAAAQRLRVASKTLQRWRRKGLPARIFTYPDGKRRIGFFLSSVERFIAAHAGEFSGASEHAPCQVDDLVTRAQRLASQGLWAEEIARRLSHRAGRSPLAVLSYLKQYESTNPGILVSPMPGPRQVRCVIHAMRRRLPLTTIARRLKLSRYTVYRIWTDHQLSRLRARRVRFIDDPLYHLPGAEEAMRELAAQRPLETASRNPVPRDLPPYLRDLYRLPLLTPARERALFLAYNFWKSQLAEASPTLLPQSARWRHIRHAQYLSRQAEDVRNEIVSANLRLVVSVAKKHLRPRLTLMELVSEGNVTLLRAVDSFDTHRGNAFSTYATFALMRCFARQIPIMLGQQAPCPDPLGLDLPDPSASRASELFEARERLAAAWQRLSPREQAIVSRSFGLDEAIATHVQLGTLMGISRQRVRQIEQKALLKLRSLLHAHPITGR